MLCSVVMKEMVALYSCKGLERDEGRLLAPAARLYTTDMGPAFRSTEQPFPLSKKLSKMSKMNTGASCRSSSDALSDTEEVWKWRAEPGERESSHGDLGFRTPLALHVASDLGREKNLAALL